MHYPIRSKGSDGFLWRDKLSSIMQIGYIFLCNNISMSECMRSERFSCLGKQVDVARELEVNSVIFLLNAETGTLLGPFTVVEGPEDLEKGTWYTSVERNRFSGNIKLTWERLHELKNAAEKVSFLKNMKDCVLSSLQTQELLRILKEAPLYPESKS
jgi:hypothetical protein